MRSSAIALGFISLLVVNLPEMALAQLVSAGSGVVRGSVLDPSGAVVPDAAVEIQNPVSGD